MAAETPQTWAERVVPYDDGDPITGREATVVGEDALNTWRAIVLGLAQSHGLSADATHAQIMEAFKQGHALTGEIKTYAGLSAPTGWLLCNGVLISITDYAALFGVLAHTYALEPDTTDSTATQFRLPDLRGRVPIGAGDGAGLTERSLGAKGGEEKHTLGIQELPAANVRTPIKTNTGSSGRDTRFGVENASPPYGVYGGFRAQGAGYPFSRLDGGNQAHENMPPFLAINYIIKT